ncbi:MAG: cytochrome c [Hyphomicrobiales bacterium]|nr:cytochrome c [Hyphomicrobiales bacterium]MBV9975642.1 cytochrome c [Hyphomicrobiales bacterium]
MRHVVSALAAAASLACLSAAVAIAATPKENHAAYVRRDNAMKEIGRSFYVGIGWVTQGKAPYSQDTVAAAENTVRLIPNMVALFPIGSDVPESHLKPGLTTDPSKVKELVEKVQKSAVSLVDEVKTGDKDKIAAIFKTVDDACQECHNAYRKPYPPQQ